MKNLKKILLFNLGIILIFSVSCITLNAPVNNDEFHETPLNIRLDAPILVDGDGDWSSVPGISGTGDPGTPYIIENKVIDGGGSTNCITIQHTRKHFIIRNCILFHGSYGIQLTNTTNGQLINNTSFDQDYSGFLLYDGCTNNWLENNIGHSNDERGIWVFHNAVTHNTLFNNTFYNNSIGIYIEQGSNHNILRANILYDNSQDGILVATSDNCTVAGNVAEQNSIGLRLYLSNNATIYDNTFYNNSQHGVYLENSHDNNLTANTINFNQENGVYLNGADDTIIVYNEIQGNKVCINETSTTGTINIGNSCNIASLSSGSVSPETGDTKVDFVYSITYTDADNQGPASIKVIINDAAHDMEKLTPSDNSYWDGVIYVYTTKLPEGSLHQYYFEAIDGTVPLRSPGSGANLGPTVTGTSIPGFSLVFVILGFVLLLATLKHTYKKLTLEKVI